MTSAGGGNGVLALAIEGAVEPGDLARLAAVQQKVENVKDLMGQNIGMVGA